MKRARRSFESFAALAKTDATPGKRENGGTVSRRSWAGTTGRADVVPGPPSAMPPQLTPLDGAVRYPHAVNGAASTGHGVATAAGLALQEVMSKPGSRRFPVTVTHLPVTRRQICHHTIACRPGKASDVLTGHYRQAHPETLGLSSSR
jgi:hypothetical protein